MDTQPDVGPGANPAQASPPPSDTAWSCLGVLVLVGLAIAG